MPLDPTKIRSRRERLTMSQREAAKAAGILPPHWSRLERGGVPTPRADTLERIAAALRCSVTDLLSESPAAQAARR